MIRRIIYLLLILLWMGGIFFYSSQNGTQSGSFSQEVTEKVQKLFFPEWAEEPEKDYEAHMGQLQFLLRKCGHFGEFLVLGGLLLCFFSTLPMGWFLRFACASVLGILYAFSDELHQYYVDGRVMSAFDVCIDGTGVIVGVLIFAGIIAMYRETKNGKQLQDAIVVTERKTLPAEKTTV